MEITTITHLPMCSGSLKRYHETCDIKDSILRGRQIEVTLNSLKEVKQNAQHEE